MTTDKPEPTLADYVAIAMNPALIMALVGSLVFFLLEVLYVGQYEGRLQWILFFFVFAAVLIARMSMIDGVAERAGIYGLVLGILVYIALQRFVVYAPGSPLHDFNWAVNLALMAIIWWCAHRLTWDCTFIDENADSSGAGLLEIAGLEGTAAASEAGEPDRGVAEDAGPAPPPESGLYGWWLRYRRYRDSARRRPHAPGVWIVYFSLAALPLFGLGQSLISADATASRRYAFWLMAIYVASGLGLLLTTSFLGLRRYLRQRHLRMPVAITATWLAMGGALIAVLLIAGAILPRPHPEYPFVNLAGLAGSGQPNASNYSMTGGRPGQGEGRPGAEGSPDGKTGSGQGSGQAGGSQPGSTSAGQSQGDNRPGQGQNQSGSGQGSQSGSSQNSSGSGTQSHQGNSGSSHGQNQSGNSQGQSGNNSSRDGSGQQPPGRPGEHASSNADANSNDSPSSDTGSSALKSLFTSLMKILKWVVFIVLAVVVAFAVLRALLKFLANFTDWAKHILAVLQGWWQGLFGWWSHSQPVADEFTEEDERTLLRPFASFHNPFADGSSNRRSPADLVRYSFEALEAWGWEHGVARSHDDTPLEFTERIAMEVPSLAADCKRLASLYERVAYARATLPESSRAHVRQFWQRLESVAGAPLSS
jgi:hypothetical protein